MFERFTERARQVVVLAQDEARALRHNYIGTEHILLGLLREDEGLAAHVLASLGISLKKARAKIVQVVAEGDKVTSGQIPFTARAKKVLELSLHEAVSMGHKYIGTEHILLGLARENDGVGAQVLSELGVDAETVRNEVISRLSSPGRDALPPGSRRRVSSRVFEGAYPVDLALVSLALEEAQRRLIDEQRVEDAAALRQRQRELHRLLHTIDSELKRVGAATPQLPGVSVRREYDVKQLQGSSETWPSQIEAWRKEGWEVLAVVTEGEARRAIVERRSTEGAG